jgi:hypothetical protein
MKNLVLPVPAVPNGREISWMENTYPLREELIDIAIHELAASNARRPLERGAMHSRVTGPFNGYYVASYACPMGDAGARFVGSYKLCQVEPLSYWNASSLFAGDCALDDATGFAAMDRAEVLAVLRIADLPLAGAEPAP